MTKYIDYKELRKRLKEETNLAMQPLETLSKFVLIIESMPTITVETCGTCANYGDELSDKWCESRKGYSGKDEFCNRWEKKKCR